MADDVEIDDPCPCCGGTIAWDGDCGDCGCEYVPATATEPATARRHEHDPGDEHDPDWSE